LKCPRCSEIRSRTPCAPYKNKRWSTFACTSRQCTYLAPAHQWHCNCNKPWRSCTRHSAWPSYAEHQRKKLVKRGHPAQSSGAPFSTSAIDLSANIFKVGQSHIRTRIGADLPASGNGMRLRQLPANVGRGGAASSVGHALSSAIPQYPSHELRWVSGILSRNPRLASRFPNLV